MGQLFIYNKQPVGSSEINMADELIDGNHVNWLAVTACTNNAIYNNTKLPALYYTSTVLANIPL